MNWIEAQKTMWSSKIKYFHYLKKALDALNNHCDLRNADTSPQIKGDYLSKT